jgi:hypothetical protein
MSATTAATLQDAILDALSDAIGLRREEVDFCRGCRNSPAGHCAEHERDYELAVAYEEAERRIRAAGSDEDVLAIAGEAALVRGGGGQK